MGEEFYCSLKLVSGEEVFSLISVDENNGDPIIILQNPVIMNVVHNQMGSIVKIKPWMEIPNDDFYLIKFDKVITMTEVDDSMIIKFYNKFLNNDSDDVNGKVKITNKMGYISSVEEARNNLEKIYNNL